LKFAQVSSVRALLFSLYIFLISVLVTVSMFLV
jgi:hypothetical protein